MIMTAGLILPPFLCLWIICWDLRLNSFYDTLVTILTVKWECPFSVIIGWIRA